MPERGCRWRGVGCSPDNDETQLGLRRVIAKQGDTLWARRSEVPRRSICKQCIVDSCRVGKQCMCWRLSEGGLCVRIDFQVHQLQRTDCLFLQ